MRGLWLNASSMTRQHTSSTVDTVATGPRSFLPPSHLDPPWAAMAALLMIFLGGGPEELGWARIHPGPT